MKHKTSRCTLCLLALLQVLDPACEEESELGNWTCWSNPKRLKLDGWFLVIFWCIMLNFASLATENTSWLFSWMEKETLTPFLYPSITKQATFPPVCLHVEEAGAERTCKLPGPSRCQVALQILIYLTHMLKLHRKLRRPFVISGSLGLFIFHTQS